MLGIMLRKMWHKKWMFVCLLLGSILLVATAASYPMYKDAVFNRMLQDEFMEYIAEEGQWPTKIDMVITSKKDKNGKSMANLEKFTKNVYEELDVTEKNSIVLYALYSANAHTLSDKEETEVKELRLSSLSQLREHSKLIAGEMYSDDGIDENGMIEVVMSQAAMIHFNLIVGEEIAFDQFTTVDGNIVKMKVVGVFAEADKNDFYWQMRPDEMELMVFMNEDLFAKNFTGENAGKYTITCRYYSLFEYEDIKASEVDTLIKKTKYMDEEGKHKTVVSTPDYMDVLDSYKVKENRISTTLFILQVPVMLLLCAFLFMISCQMYDMERNEISVIKSRGASRGQIFRLYLYNSVFLSAVGMLGGLPLGSLFCRILGSANNFLEFGIRRKLEVTYSSEVMLYALVAVGISILIMTIPALKHSKLSIVKLKQAKAIKKKSWWEKCFLDVIFLGISIYGFYNFSNNTDGLIESALKSEALDPLLYISSSLFILGMGMLLLRLQPLLVSLIYLITKRHCGPASYASFMETIKNGRKQQYIMLFMILTVSLGMFDAVSARTILQNTLDNKEYVEGADIVMQEQWKDNSAFMGTDPSIEFQYYEPEYGKYAALECAESYTKVLNDKNAYAVVNGSGHQTVQVMGIHTKEFGQITHVDDDLLKEPYYKYLNDLAVVSNGVLVSSNFKSAYGFEIGDEIVFYDFAESKGRGYIVGFFDYWPTYEPSSITLDEENNINRTSNYMIVGHINTLQQYWGVTPYEVWIDVRDGENTDSFYDWVANNNVSMKSYVDRTQELENVIEDPLIQGMNGVLTMSFIVMIILCAVGYLIYWIMSIRSREMMFGVLRAFGMHKGEVLHMLINEQVFSGIYSIFAGIFIGTLAYKMFVPMLQMAYSTTSQVLPLTLITQMSDMLRLYAVVGVTMVVCLVVLATLVFKLNITKALKLGEE